MNTCMDHGMSVGTSGYSNTTVEGVWTTRHRKSWEEFSGLKVPKGGVVRHSCDNKRCVNPTHLTLGTRAQNVKDSVDRGLMPSGESHHNSKLSDKAVKHIKFLLWCGDTHKDIAEEFGISRITVTDIKSGRLHKNTTLFSEI